jgi:hypothetical protein
MVQVVRDVADLVNLRHRLDEWHRETNLNQQEQDVDSLHDSVCYDDSCDGSTMSSSSISSSTSASNSGAGAAVVAQWSGWGPTSVEKVLAAVELAAAAPLPAYRLLYALGVRKA